MAGYLDPTVKIQLAKMLILDPTGTYLRPPTNIGSTDSPTKSSASNTSASATRRYGQQLASAYLDPTGQY